MLIISLQYEYLLLDIINYYLLDNYLNSNAVFSWNAQILPHYFLEGILIAYAVIL